MIELERKTIDFLVGLSKKDFNRILWKINRIRSNFLGKQNDDNFDVKVVENTYDEMV